MTLIKRGLIILLSYLCFSVYGQNVVSGRIADISTKTSVEYAVVRYGLSNGVITDSSGHFSIPLQKNIREFSINMMGYKPRKINLDTLKNITDITVFITPSSINLSDVVIKPTKRKKREIDTAALYVLKMIRNNKDLNNPEKISSYSLNEHTKMVLSLKNVSQKFLKSKVVRPFKFFLDMPDSTDNGELRYPILIQEEYNQTFHEASPKLNRKLVSYRKISGLKGKYLANLAADQFKTIDIYKDVYTIGQSSFTSPFSIAGRAVYRYFIIDTIRDENGTEYRLNFVGKNKEDVALKGVATVDSATWGIRSITFNPNEKANINYITDYTVHQNYAYVQNRWLLMDERLSIMANIFDSRKMLSAHISKLSVRDSVVTNIEIPKQIKKAKDNDLLVNAFNKPKSYIDSMRIAELEESEEHIYWAFDTVKNVKAFKQLKWVANLITTGNLKAGGVEFGRLDQVISRNATENFRLKMGVSTNEQFSKKLFLSGYFAYGFATKKFNFGSEISARLSSKYERWHSITLFDKFDMMALGREDALIPFDHFFSLFSTRPARVIQYSANGFSYEWDWFKDLSSTFKFARTRYYSVPNKYTFTTGEGVPLAVGDGAYQKGAFGTTELSVDIRYQKNSQYIEHYGKRKFIPSKSPTFYFRATLGLKESLLGGEYNYGKFEFQLKHTLQMPVVGYGNINFKSGYMVGQVPFTSAFTAPSNVSFLKDNNSFDLINPFEFQFDKYVMFHYEHHFQGLLFNRIPYVNKAKLREYISFKAMYGAYSPSNQSLIRLFPETHSVTTLPYIEVGAGIENILKIFQVGFYWRATYRDTPNAANFAVKLGIKPGF